MIAENHQPDSPSPSESTVNEHYNQLIQNFDEMRRDPTKSAAEIAKWDKFFEKAKTEHQATLRKLETHTQNARETLMREVWDKNPAFGEPIVKPKHITESRETRSGFPNFVSKETRSFLGKPPTYHAEMSAAIIEAERQSSFDRYDILALIMVESDYKDKADSGVASGLMQLKPTVFRQYFKRGDIFNVRLNILAGVRHLEWTYQTLKHELKKRPNIHRTDSEVKQLAFAAYNAGVNAIVKREFNIPRFQQTIQNFFAPPHYAANFRRGQTSFENKLTGKQATKMLRNYETRHKLNPVKTKELERMAML